MGDYSKLTAWPDFPLMRNVWELCHCALHTMPSRHMGGVLQAPQDPIQGIETKKRNNTSLYFPVIPLEGTISASKRPYVVPFMTYGDVTDPHMLRPILPSLFRHFRPCWCRRFVLAVTISGTRGLGEDNAIMVLCSSSHFNVRQEKIWRLVPGSRPSARWQTFIGRGR